MYWTTHWQRIAGALAVLALVGCSDQGLPTGLAERQSLPRPYKADASRLTGKTLDGSHDLDLRRTLVDELVVIDFEGLPSETPVTDQYEALGVIFSGATILKQDISLNPEYPPRSGENVIYDEETGDGVITATFTNPVSRAGGYVTSFTIVTLRCYDDGGNLLGSSSLPAPNYVGAETGVDPNYQLEVDAPGIVRCTFQDTGNTYTVDDFFFTAAEVPPCMPVTIDNVYSGPPARAPGIISLDDQFVFVEIFDVEAYLPRSASPEDVRMGESQETGTPAAGFTILDIDQDGMRDIRLRFSISQLIADGNLSQETTELDVWGLDPNNDQQHCGGAQVTVIGGDPEVLFYDNFDQENNGVGALNYSGFVHWNVAKGSVDLIGNGFFDFYPGNGLYVDLDGSIGIAGRLETKTEFTLTPATYVLEFQLGGSQRGDTNTVEVSLGSVYSESFTLPSATPLTSYTRSIPVASTTSARIAFDHAGGDNLGLILAEVRLSRAP